MSSSDDKVWKDQKGTAVDPLVHIERPSTAVPLAASGRSVIYESTIEGHIFRVVLLNSITDDTMVLVGGGRTFVESCAIASAATLGLFSDNAKPDFVRFGDLDPISRGLYRASKSGIHTVIRVTTKVPSSMVSPFLSERFT